MMSHPDPDTDGLGRDPDAEVLPVRQRWAGWVRPTPAEAIGLALLVLGSIVATLLWWGQSVTGPDALDAIQAVGAAVTAEGHAHGPAPGVVPDPAGPMAGTPDGAAPHRPGSAHGEVTVHVSGGVARPGLVTLPSGGRVGDAVVAAGGLTRDADPDRINLARTLVDGEHVHLPRLGESAAGAPPGAGSADDGAGETGTGSPGTTPEGLIDLNRATAAELEQLPGIGPARAAAIIEYRELHGPFAVPGDLRGVSGIGEATFQRLAPLVVVR